MKKLERNIHTWKIEKKVILTSGWKFGGYIEGTIEEANARASEILDQEEVYQVRYGDHGNATSGIYLPQFLD